MAKINTYQRQQLASARTQIAPQNQAGEMVAKDVVNLGTALAQRQEVLDNAEATKAYYKYVAADSLQTAELQKQYMNDPNLDPLTFGEKYEERTTTLAQTFTEQLPGRVQGKFSLLVEKQKASQTISNNKWALDQQNRNALLGFQEMNISSIALAGEAMNAEDYLKGRDFYMNSLDNYRSVMTPNSLASASKTTLKQQAGAYWNNNVDFRNGGNPVSFKESLISNPELRKSLEQDLGTTAFARLEKGLDNVIKQMGVHQGFQKLMSDDKQLTERVQKIFDPDSNYGLKDISTELDAEINYKNYMTNTNKEGQNTQAIEQSEKNIKNLETLKRIAIVANDATYSSDIDTKSRTYAEIRVAMSPFSGDTFEKKLAKAESDIAKPTNRPWYSSLNPVVFYRELGRNAQALITGVSPGVIAEAKENIKANQSLSNYMESVYEMKGRILNAVEERKLTYKDATDLISKLGTLSSVDKYDSLSAQGSNWFTQGFDAFSDYVRNFDLRTGTVEGNRQFRDDVRNQMLDTFSTRVASYGDVTLTPAKISEIINQVKNEKSQQLYPEFAGLKMGDIATVNGRSVEFMGFGGNNGKPQFKVKGIQKEVDNL